MRHFILILAFLVGLCLPSVGFADNVSVRTSKHKDFGRIVFSWPEPVSHKLQINGSDLILRFGRPISASLERVRGALGQYVSAIESADDGISIRVKLAGDFDAYSYDTGASVILEIAIPITEKADENEPEPATSRATQPKAPTAKIVKLNTDKGEVVENINVRAGEHDSYTRLVFDWVSKVDYTFEKKPGTIFLHFKRPADLNLLKFQKSPPRFVGQIKSLVSVEGLRVAIAVSKTSSVKHFLSGPKFVLDIRAPTGTKTIAALAKDVFGSASAQQTELNVKQSDVPPKPAAITKITNPTQKTAPLSIQQKSALPPDEHTDGEQGGATKAIGKPTALVADKQKMPVQASQSSDVEAVAARVSGNDGGTEKGTTLRFDWDEPVGAAVFRRIGYLWIVFDKSTQVDLPALELAAGGMIRSLQQVPATSGTVLRMITTNGIHPSLALSGLSWLINFKKQEFLARTPIEVKAQPEYPAGARIFVPITEPSTPIGVTDPDVGDNLVIVPVIPLGHGVAIAHTYPEVRVLKSMQGVAVVPITDSLRIRPLRQGIELASSVPLSLSSVSAAVAAGSKIGGVRTISRVLDLEKWKVPDLKTFMERKQELQKSLSKANSTEEEQKNRLDLARFYFAHAFAAEVLGVLRTVADADPAIVDTAEFRLLRGGASYLMHRFSDAVEDLSHSSLDGVDEGDFWRAAVIAKSGEMIGAAQELRRTGTITQQYPKQLRIPMATLVADAVVSIGDIQQGQQYIEALKLVGLSKRQLAEVNFIEGKLLEVDGDEGSALLKWEEVLEVDNRPTRYKATMARMEILLKADRMGPEEAIEELEQLRFVWRGDEYEFNLLRRLGTLYLDTKNYRRGLLALRQAATYYRDNISAPEVTQKMSDTFKALYLKGDADQIPPVTAIALYDEFKELTPAGSLGDEMIRNLADRLVRVDLLFKAAELLENQLQFRLKGVEKSQVGLNLALIYALAQEYGKVIETLDATNEPNLPEELVADRLHLRAQALMNLDQQSSALLLLKTDKSLNADLIRSELYWLMKDWKSAALSLHNVVRQSGLKPGEDLSEIDAAKILNLATAYTLSGNERAIQRIRMDYSEPMAKTSVKEAFELLAQPLSIGMIDPASIAQRVKIVTNFRSYLDTYKERLKKERLSNLSRFGAIPKG